MGISNYYSMGYLNSNVSNLFATNASSSSNALNNIFYGANYYKAATSYAIANKYKNEATTSKTEATTSATNFLNSFDSNYSSLKDATSSLKNALQDDNKDIISAAKDYVSAYNKVTSFLEDKSSTVTNRLNVLKSSLSAVTDVASSSLAGVGITKNSDGTLSLNEKALQSALTKNTASATRTLNSLASRTTVNTNMADSSSKTSLVTEQNKSLATALTTDHDATYESFLALAKNPTALNNYYYKLSTAGIFMDIAL